MLSNFQLSSLNAHIVASHSLLPYTQHHADGVPAMNWSAAAQGTLKWGEKKKKNQQTKTTTTNPWRWLKPFLPLTDKKTPDFLKQLVLWELSLRELMVFILLEMLDAHRERILNKAPMKWDTPNLKLLLKLKSGWNIFLRFYYYDYVITFNIFKNII